MNTRRLLGAGVAALTFAPNAHAQSCDPFWLAPIPHGGAPVRSMVAVDDGSGPALYFLSDAVYRWDGRERTTLTPLVDARVLAAGRGPAGPALFALAGLAVMRWAGTAWEPLPPVPPPPGSTTWQVLALGGTIESSMSLAAATTDESTNFPRYATVVAWNGSSWSVLRQFTSTPERFYVAGSVAFDGLGWAWGGSLVPGATASFGDGGYGQSTWSCNNNYPCGVQVVAAARLNGRRAVFASGDICCADFICGSAVNNVLQIAEGLSPRGIDAGMTGLVRAAANLAGDPAAYLAGTISRSAAPAISNLGRWDGTNWSPLGLGTNGRINALVAFDDGSGEALYAAGSFSQAGGAAAPGLARWGRQPCLANCDGSRDAAGCPTLTADDFLCFQGRFLAGDARANCDGSTAPPRLNVNDYICFMTRFAAGCP